MCVLQRQCQRRRVAIRPKVVGGAQFPFAISGRSLCFAPSLPVFPSLPLPALLLLFMSLCLVIGESLRPLPPLLSSRAAPFISVLSLWRAVRAEVAVVVVGMKAAARTAAVALLLSLFG